MLTEQELAESVRTALAEVGTVREVKMLARNGHESERKTKVIKRFSLGILAYLVPTFALGIVWHLILFQHYYDELAIYRKDIIIPFGFLSMLIQAIIFAWIYEKAFARGGGTLLSRSLAYAALGAVLSWSFTTLAVAAKNIMTSVPNYLVIETAFTVVQWVMVGPLTTFALAGADRKRPVTA